MTRRTLPLVLVTAATFVGPLVMSGTAQAATPSAGQAVFIVKDQAGGAFYNIGTGERFMVTAASAGQTLGVFGIEAADGVVMDETGQLFAPVGSASRGTPADSVVTVTETTGAAAYVDASTGAKYAVVTAGNAVPAGNELALKTTTNVLLTINQKVLLPVQGAALH